MSCERCGQGTEAGTLLVSSSVLWHEKPSFFLQPGPAFPAATMGRADYYPFPVPLAATRCGSCGWVFVAPDGSCSHSRAAGYIFPMASLRWWPGPQPFEASVWFTINGKSKDGTECEALVRRGFVVSVVDTRVEAARCSTCGSIAFRSEMP